jgi:hypothetical protein
MYNPETLATLGTKDTGRRQAKHKNTTQYRKTKKTKNISNTDPTKHRELNLGVREGKAVPASYKTHLL